MELLNFTISRIHQGLIKKEFSAFELCQAYLKRIEKEDKNISAFLTITEELALSQAKEVDKMIFSKKEIPFLAGVPLAIKDNILVKDIKCTAASKILENYVAPYDATVVKKIKEQGGVILGKTNLDEFAMGSSTENSAFGPTKNPYDLQRVPGGSSGGSAAAVAANFSVYALGSDTGGSIRQPASFCGVVGLKPTYGSVSRYGLIAFASSLDQIGPITKTVDDAKIVFDVIKGKDPLDSTSFEVSLESERRKMVLEELIIGVPKEYFLKDMDERVEKIIRMVIKRYEEAGVKIQEISLPHTEYALSCYYIIAPSEASANLARYDGIKYGYSEDDSGNDLLAVYFNSRGKGFGPEVKRRIMLGTYSLSSGYYDAYYLRAQKVRTLIKKDFQKAFQQVDAIITPVTPTPAFKLGEKITDPLTMYLSDIFTVAVNLAGLPALSMPAGQIKDEISGLGLPLGFQIIGKPFSEDEILEIGSLFNNGLI
jgi:aspartyl-tRNA(Asn)/glutamyl-tRNA(Gln) amidotransferase subunit A